MNIKNVDNNRIKIMYLDENKMMEMFSGYIKTLI